MKKRTFLSVAACALVLTTQGVTAGDTVRLRFAHAGSAESSQHKAAKLFADEVRKNSDERLRVQVYHNSQLGNDATVIGGVRGGTIDIMMAGSVNFAGLLPQMGALDLPFLFRDAAHAYATLDGKVGSDLMAGLREHQLEGLGWFEVGFRSITTSNRAVRTPDDVKGLKIRTTTNPSQIMAFRLLGTNPVPMPLGELYQALETGAVDAQEHPVSITWSSKFYEVQKYLTVSHHAYTAMPVVMNRQRFESLAPDLQKVLKDAARKASAFQRDLNNRNEAEELKKLEDEGMEVIRDFDPKPFKDIVVEKTRQDFIQKNGDAVLKDIDAVQTP
ncbi:MAG: TRAP transporter substrate-binding protein [Lautropia sp.]|nr:TRAP transporter substrate-binding protein [Lautropia sp.]